MGDRLTFEPAAHVYHFDGVRVPSVTQCLEQLDEIWRVPAEVLEYARQLGSAVHMACELDDQDELDEESVPDVVGPYLAAWRRFRAESGFAIEMNEQQVYHPLHRYAGTVDRVGILYGERAVIDIKSGAAWASHGPQLSAYKNAIEAQTGRKVKHRYAVYLGENGKYRVKRQDNQQDWGVYLACLTLFRFKQELSNG